MSSSVRARLSIDQYLSPPGRRMLLAGFSVVGFVMGLMLLLQHGIYLSGGDGGVDILAYWTAGGHLAVGEPLYQAGVGGHAAFLYPPPLAQLFAPLSLLPFWVVVWIWRIISIAALRVAVGSWRNAGLALLLWPPVIAEIDAGNVHLLLAAATALAIRGRSGALAVAGLTKFATLAAAPMALTRDWRGLVAGGLVAALVVLVSAFIAPDLWVAYVQFAQAPPPPTPDWYNIGDHVPGALRYGAAAFLAVAAIRWPRLAAPAVTLALPVLWIHGLSVLVAAVAKPSATRRPREG